MKLTCQYQFPDVKSSPFGAFTVGDIFFSECVLDEAVSIDLSHLKYKPAEKKSEYDLVVVSAASHDLSVNLALTSYVPGPKSFDGFELSDGKVVVKVESPLSFNVQSVIKQNEKVEPFGPMSGLLIPIPLSYWIFLVIIFFTIVASSIGLWVSFKRKKKLEVDLDALETGVSPLNQFFSSYRKLQRQYPIFFSGKDQEDFISKEQFNEFVVDLEATLKLYVARVLRTDRPSTVWKIHSRKLKSKNQVLNDFIGMDLLRLAEEIEKAKVANDKIKNKDGYFLAEKTRRWVEKTDQVQVALRNSDRILLKKLQGVKV